MGNADRNGIPIESRSMSAVEDVSNEDTLLSIQLFGGAAVGGGVEGVEVEETTFKRLSDEGAAVGNVEGEEMQLL